jgi:hypothetical protein
MFKKLLLIAVVLTALLAMASPALALQYGNPGMYYVDTAYTGTEMGTQTQPFNTVNEAVATAQSNPYGGYIYTMTNGAWTYYQFIPGVWPPYTGTSLSGPALFVLLGLASLILVATGWFLMRRGRTLHSPA